MAELNGIDISKWQPTINWNKLAANKEVTFVIMRAASGLGYDSKFKEHVAECRRVGIPFGLYFASKATTPEEAAAEARLAISVTKEYKPDYPVWFDVELANQRALGKAKVTALLTTWLDAVSATGIRCGYYSNRDWLNNVFDRSKLAKYPLWYAAYPSTVEKRISDAPKNNRAKLSYPQAVIWQWTSSGKVDGIDPHDRVDLNICYEDLTQPPDTSAPAPQKKYITLAELKKLGYDGVIIE